VILTAGLGIASCASVAPGNFIAPREDVITNIAKPARMIKREIQAGAFLLTVYEHVHNRGGMAQIYIEGDGLAWIRRRMPSLDPTPVDPVAMRLAVRDSAANVIYMARPCQYSKMARGYSRPCPMKYWTSKRFAPEVINAMISQP